MKPDPGNIPAGLDAWKRQVAEVSLPEVHRSIFVPGKASFWRKMLAFAGPGFLVAVGYMDPGNWATDLAGGAQFGYALLSVILLSNLMAILLQHLSLKLGVATGRDLAQACRDHYSKPVVWILWGLCELAIAACDLAEVVRQWSERTTRRRRPSAKRCGSRGKSPGAKSPRSRRAHRGPKTR
jgi:manganese transport protein